MIILFLLLFFLIINPVLNPSTKRLVRASKIWKTLVFDEKYIHSELLNSFKNRKSKINSFMLKLIVRLSITFLIYSLTFITIYTIFLSIYKLNSCNGH